MAEYQYNGYTITETTDGYYQIGDYVFVSYDDACDWVDDMLDDEYDGDHLIPIEPAVIPDEDVELTSKLHTYQVFYVLRGSMSSEYEFIDAPDADSAVAKLYRMYPDVLYVTDCLLVE